MEQDNQIQKESEEDEYGEINANLPFPKVLSQYYVPRDAEDPSYIQSFSIDEPDKIKSFFNHFGFVVVRNVLNSDECLESINEIYNIPESSGKFRRDNIDTWDDKSWPRDAMLKHGMPCKAPIFTTQFLKNRQNPNVHRAFATILGVDDLLVSHDRASFLRPTKSIVYEGKMQDMKQWKTATNIHMDMGPWDYIHNPQRFENALGALEYGIQHLNQFIFENNQIMSTVNNGLHVQGVLNLADNVENDGGFQIVPGKERCCVVFDWKGFKNHFGEWVKINQGTELQKIADERGSVPISDNDALQAYTVRVPMRAGSMVIWDQRSPHGAVSNDRPRMAQFIKMFPAKPIHPVRADKRRETILYMCKKVNFFPHLTPLGAKLFDLPESLAQAKPKEEVKKKKNRVQGGWSTKS